MRLFAFALMLLGLFASFSPARAQDVLTLAFSAGSEGEYAPCPT